MADDNFWMERAQSAEAKLETLKQAIEPMKQRIQDFKANFGLQERSDGSITIDYDKFVTALGIESALELRSIIDEKYQISGKPGKKPRIRLAV